MIILDTTSNNTFQNAHNTISHLPWSFSNDASNPFHWDRETLGFFAWIWGHFLQVVAMTVCDLRDEVIEGWAQPCPVHWAVWATPPAIELRHSGVRLGYSLPHPASAPTSQRRVILTLCQNATPVPPSAALPALKSSLHPNHSSSLSLLVSFLLLLTLNYTVGQQQLRLTFT